MFRNRFVVLAALLVISPAVVVAQEAPVPTSAPAVKPLGDVAPSMGGNAVVLEGESEGNKLSEQVVSQITHEVSNEVLSPFCPGKTLAMCPSPAAAEARRTIQSLAEKGLTKDQIVDELIDQYGSEFKRVTPGLDDNLVVLVLVIIGLLFCSIFVWFLSFRGRRKESSNDTDSTLDTEPDADPDNETDDYLNSLRDEYKS